MSALRPLFRDLLGLILYRLGATRLGRRGPAFLTIVTFHRVLPPDHLSQYPFPQLAVTPEELRWFLALFDRHFRCGPLRDAWNAWDEDDTVPRLAITFDDGQLDNYLHARPVLEEMGLRATFYVVSDFATSGDALWHDRVASQVQWLAVHRPAVLRVLLRSLGVPSSCSTSDVERPDQSGQVDQVGRVDQLDRADQCVQRLKQVSDDERRRWIEAVDAEVEGIDRPPWDGLMNWQQIREMALAGHEIGSHSRTHAILTRCDSAALVREIDGSKRDIEDRIDGEVVSFCYPNGDHDSAVRAAVAAAGYRNAVTTRWGLNGRGHDPFSLQRCDIQSSTALSFRGTLSEARVGWRLSGYHPGLR